PAAPSGRRRGSASLRTSGPPSEAGDAGRDLMSGDGLLAHESAVRLGCFFGALSLMAVWEALAPRRPLTQGRPRRWPGNLGLVALDTLATRLLAPLGAVGVALL